MKFRIDYKYRKNGTSSFTHTTTTVEATTEDGAIKVVNSKHLGCEIELKSIRKS